LPGISGWDAGIETDLLEIGDEHEEPEIPVAGQSSGALPAIEARSRRGQGRLMGPTPAAGREISIITSCGVSGFRIEQMKAMRLAPRRRFTRPLPPCPRK
jgi:hypothetical protein